MASEVKLAWKFTACLYPSHPVFSEPRVNLLNVKPVDIADTITGVRPEAEVVEHDDLEVLHELRKEQDQVARCTAVPMSHH